MSVKHRYEAWRELLKRYREVWRFHWQRRQELVLPDLQAHEAEFLPAALAIQSRPVSPLGRWLGRVLMGLIAVLLLWSVLGRIDIVVNAQGKIIPSQRIKTITSAEVARVQRLLVQEGQAVKAGDLLIELDARSTEAEADKANAEWQNAALQAARARAMLQALSGGHTFPVLVVDQEVQPQRAEDAKRHLQDQWRDFVAKQARLDAEIVRFLQALPLATQRARDYAELLKTQDVAQHAWLEKEQQRIELEGQLASTKTQKTALIAEVRKAAQESLAEGVRGMSVSQQDSRRATVRGDLFKLVAPVDGTVQQLAVHTVGAAVPAAQPLMQIVPSQGLIEMQAFIENKDVGFVREGQEATVKIEAFPYTKYGTLPGKVISVSRDAIEDEKRGLIYSVKVQLLRHHLRVDGRDLELSTGMSGTVEIKTGRRRIIEYVLSPLMVYSRETLRER
jgi:hemolysin D